MAALMAGGLGISAALLGLTATASTAAPRAPTAKAGDVSASAAYPSPLWTDQIGSTTGFTSPTFATIGGVRVIVAASLDGEVYVVNAITGEELPGWPERVDITGDTPTAVESSPTVAYLDGPSEPPTIIVGAGSQSVPYQNGGVMAFYATGQVRFVFHTKDTFAQWKNATNDNSVFSTIAVGDIQGNGEQDIVFGSYDHHIYALTPSGALVSGFPIQRADTIWSSPALVDSSHTGRDDIILGGDSTGMKTEGGVPCFGGWVTDYRYSSGAHAPELVWEQCVGQTVWSSPAVGVINPGPDNPSNEPAVVVGTSFNQPYAGNRATNEIFAFYVGNGAPVPGWPVTASGPTFGSPVIAQTTFGGPPVVISTSCAHCIHGPAIVSEWSGTGKILWSTDVSPQYQMLSSPIVINVSGSGVNDVLVGSNPGVAVLDAATGGFLYNTNVDELGHYCNAEDTPATSPVRGAGAPASGWEVAFSCVKGGAAWLYAYPLPAPPDTTAPFAEWRANPARTGIADPTSGGKLACSPAATAGYRLLRADGKMLPVDTGNCGALGTQVIPAPVAGEATTPDGGGYWIADSDGKVYAFGDAKWVGDVYSRNWSGGSVPPGAPVVSIAVAAGSYSGYYLLDGEGNVYAFGAPYYGEPLSPNGTPVAIVPDPQGDGYWVVTSSGYAYAFGAAATLPQATGVAHIVGASATPTGDGLWLVSSNGTIHPLGDGAQSWNSPAVGGHGEPATTPATPIVGITTAPSGQGYYMTAQNGVVYAFGPGAPIDPAVPAQNEPIVAISAP